MLFRSFLYPISRGAPFPGERAEPSGSHPSIRFTSRLPQAPADLALLPSTSCSANSRVENPPLLLAGRLWGLGHHSIGQPMLHDPLPAARGAVLAAAAVAGLPSALSISSIERRLVSKPMNQNAKAPSTYQKAK